MFDGDRLTGSVTRREREFSRSDVALLLARLRAKREPVGPHGYPLSEATDPKWNPSVDNGHQVEVPLPKTDWFEHVKNIHQDRYYEQYPNADRRSQLWSIRPIEP